MANIIFKPICQCNANCIYCDVVKGNNKKIMDLSLVEIVFQRINEFLMLNPKESINFTWHGGEVCLLGDDYFLKVKQIQDKVCNKTKSRIKHLVQSNITIINQKIIDVFKLLGVRSIGTSFDPVPDIRGLGENRDSKLYTKKFLEGINLLRKNNLIWSIIYVVHKKSLNRAKEILYYLTNLNIEGLPVFNKLHVYGNEYQELKISADEFACFLGEILSIYWEKRNTRFFEVSPISSFIKIVENKNAALTCNYSGDCANNIFYIGPDGESSQCNSSADFNIINYGNIRDNSIDNIFAHKVKKDINMRQKYLKENECSGCRFWGICHGECPVEAYIKYNSFFNKSSNCDWIKIFFQKYFEPITGLKVNLLPVKY